MVDKPPQRCHNPHQWRRLLLSPHCLLRPNDRYVLLGLSLWANRAGLCWPSQELVARRVGVSRQKVIRATRSGEEAGWIIRSHIRAGKGHNSYRNQLALPWHVATEVELNPDLFRELLSNPEHM